MKRTTLLVWGFGLLAGLSGIARAGDLTLPDEGIVLTGAARVPLTAMLQDVSVLTEADIARAHAKSLPDLLRNVAGLEIYDLSGDFTQPVVNARGYAWGDRLTVYIDGVPAENMADGTPAWLDFPLALVRRIEVRRGTGAPLYGSSPAASVFVFLKDGLSQLAGDIDGVASPDNGYGLSVSARGVEGNLQITGAAERQWWHGWRDHSDYRGTTVAVRGGLLLSQQADLVFGMRLRNAATGWPGALDRNRRENARETTLTPDDGEQRDDFSGYLRYQRDLLPELRWEGTIDYAGQNSNSYTTPGEEEHNGWQLGTRQQGTWITQFGPLQHQLIGGGEYRLTLDEAAAFNAPQRQRLGQLGDAGIRTWRAAAFLDDYMTFYDWPVYAEVGLRYDSTRYRLRDNFNVNNGSAPHWRGNSPVLGLGWRFRPEGLLWSRWSSTLTPPAIGTVTPLAGAGGNQNMPAERDRALEMGWRQSFGEVEGYLTWFTHDVRSPLANAAGAWRTEEMSLQRGVVLGGAFALQDKWRGTMNYTFTDARWRGGVYGDRTVPLVARRQCNAGLEYIDTARGFDIGVMLHYASRRYIDYANVYFLHSQIAWDAIANYYWNGYTVYLQALNLADHEYDEAGSVAANVEALLPHHDRQFRAGMKYEF